MKRGESYGEGSLVSVIVLASGLYVLELVGGGNDLRFRAVARPGVAVSGGVRWLAHI